MIIKLPNFWFTVDGVEYPKQPTLDPVYPPSVSGCIQVEETWEEWEFLASVVYDVPYTKIRAIPPGLFPFF